MPRQGEAEFCGSGFKPGRQVTAKGHGPSLNICYLVLPGEVLDQIQGFWKIQIGHSITSRSSTAFVTMLLQQFQDQLWGILLDGLLDRVKGQSSHDCHLSLLLGTQIFDDPGFLCVVALNINERTEVTTAIQHCVVACLDVSLTSLGNKEGLVELSQAADHAIQPVLLIWITRKIDRFRGIIFKVEQAACGAISSPVVAISQVNLLF
mmetsp:Transcript_14791/g.17756  ORF Transcript_14791/g.17756 Transcript_14791/m.17756 type:complete len:207 (-) Transcript_14791:186-806(-)